jgi:hypothetical protein
VPTRWKLRAAIKGVVRAPHGAGASGLEPVKNNQVSPDALETSIMKTAVEHASGNLDDPHAPRLAASHLRRIHPW